jgi:hypothetical protein
VIGGAYHFVEAEAENYLRALAGLDPLPRDPSAPVRLIRLSTLAARRDRGSKTLKRELEKTYGRIDGTVEPAAAAAAKRPADPQARRQRRHGHRRSVRRDQKV